VPFIACHALPILETISWYMAGAIGTPVRFVLCSATSIGHVLSRSSECFQICIRCFSDALWRNLAICLVHDPQKEVIISVSQTPQPFSSLSCTCPPVNSYPGQALLHLLWEHFWEQQPSQQSLFWLSGHQRDLEKPKQVVYRRCLTGKVCMFCTQAISRFKCLPHCGYSYQ
jgi:hypothetical protein